MEAKEADNSNKAIKKLAVFFAGLSLLMTLRVGLNAASFCVKRFKIEEEFFSLYVTRLHNAMEIGVFVAVVLMTIYVASCGKNLGYLSVAGNWAFFLMHFVLLLVFVSGGETGHLTLFYYCLVGSAFNYGINQVCAFNISGGDVVFYMVGMPVSGILISLYQMLFLRFFGDRTKYDTDFLLVSIQIVLATLIALAAAALWTLAFIEYDVTNGGKKSEQKKESENATTLHVISPMLMCILGLGFIYAIYPAVAPGLLVDFSHLGKIDMVILIISAVPSLLIVVISEFTKNGPNKKWDDTNIFWHGFLAFPILEIILAILFLRVLHYRSTKLSMAIMNKPLTAGIFTVVFFTCHSVALAVGFPGVSANGPKLSSLNLMLALVLMNVMELLGEGYVMEFKKYTRYNWPTRAMTDIEALGFWIRAAFFNSLKSVSSVITKDLRADIVGETSV